MFYRTDQGHGLKRNPFLALVAPRPIGWISSLSRAGGVNLAPFSFFNAVSSDPPIVFFGANGPHGHGGLKDSYQNVLDTGEFVANICTYELRAQMVQSSAGVPHEVDEMALVGLTAAPSALVKPPRVAEAPVHLECRLITAIELPPGGKGQANHTVFGRVIGVHIDDSILVDGMVDMKKFRPVARLGYLDYTVVDNVFAMARPPGGGG